MPTAPTAWTTLAPWLRRAAEVGLPLRWVGGPQLAWNLAADLELALLIDGPYSLGPLSPAELEPWAARQLGGESPPSAVSIPDPDRLPLLKLTSGMLPVLELFRSWLRDSPGKFPDPLRQQDAEAFLDDLARHPNKAGRAAERLIKEVPAELRLGLHHLYTSAKDFGCEVWSRGDVPELSEHFKTMNADTLARLLDAATWLRLLPESSALGQIQVPYGSVLGVLIRQPRFAPA